MDFLNYLEYHLLLLISVVFFEAVRELLASNTHLVLVEGS